MTTSPQLSSKKAQTHQRILSTAARMIRKDGFEALAVADLMKQAGLTHGGFYAHFANRDALLAEALDYARRDSAAVLSQHTTADHKTDNTTDNTAAAAALQQFLTLYLSESHLQASPQGEGCPVAALSSEFHRLDPQGQVVAARTVDALVQRIEDIGAGLLNTEQAFLFASAMVGALQLARTATPERAAVLLASSRQQLTTLFMPLRPDNRFL